MNRKTENALKKVFEFRMWCEDEEPLQEDAEKKAAALKKKTDAAMKDAGAGEKKILACAKKYLDSVKEENVSSEDAAFESLYAAVEVAGYDAKALCLQGHLDFCAAGCVQTAKDAGAESLAAEIKSVFKDAGRLLSMNEEDCVRFIQKYNALIKDIAAAPKCRERFGRYGSDTEMKFCIWNGISRIVKHVRDAKTFQNLFLASVREEEAKAFADEDALYDLCCDAEEKCGLHFETGPSGKPILDGLQMASLRDQGLCGEAFSLITDDDEKEAFLSAMPKIVSEPEELAGLLSRGEAEIAFTYFEGFFILNGHGFSRGGFVSDGLLTFGFVVDQDKRKWGLVQAMLDEGPALTDWGNPDAMCDYFDSQVDGLISEAEKRLLEIDTFMAGAGKETRYAWLSLLHDAYRRACSNILERYLQYAQNIEIYAGAGAEKDAAIEQYNRKSASGQEMKERIAQALSAEEDE